MCTLLLLSLLQYPSTVVPEAPPENVTAVVISSTAIMVRWSEVASLAQNGEITHYEVQFFPLVEFDGGIYNGSVPTANMSIVLADLQEYVTYNISVRAYNGAGAGPFSNGIPITTLQDGTYFNNLQDTSLTESLTQHVTGHLTKHLLTGHH